MLILLIFKGFLFCYCVGSMLTDPREDGTPPLRIPNPDKVLNTVLGRLEKNRQERMENIPTNDFNCGGPTPQFQTLPEYTETLHSARERGLRQIVAQQKHHPICHLERNIRRLNTIEYEYRPAYYEEIRCIPNSEETNTSNEVICSSLGFSCVQWNKTIHLTRRRYDSDCWQTKTMIIPAGCECMWPVQQLGDMQYHL